MTKLVYDAKKAHSEYEETLVDSREGIDLTTSQAKELGDLLKPFIDQGQSLYAIKTNHPEIQQSVRSLYNYICDGVFSQNGLYHIDLSMKDN